MLNGRLKILCTSKEGEKNPHSLMLKGGNKLLIFFFFFFFLTNGWEGYNVLDFFSRGNLRCGVNEVKSVINP